MAERFVVQEHHATRLHWDLRLERDGALVSWAVPNGIPTDPAENRKAVHVEDHPLEFIDFEGTIPEGSYGAGRMTIWDRGTYTAERWERGKVVARFEGARVRGRYALFRAGAQERDWMIHRIDPPEDSDREPMPERLVPMLARLSTLPGDDAGWAYEIEWHGIRAIAYSLPGRLRLETRNLNDVIARYPELRPLNRALSHHEAVLDGEIVAFDDEGRPSFERLQRRMHVTGEAAIRRLAAALPVTYVIFDVLYLDGHSLMGWPYEERREALAGLELDAERWQTPAHHVGDGAQLLEVSRGQGLEGIVAKRLGSVYEPGRRSGAWLTVKHPRRALRDDDEEPGRAELGLAPLLADAQRLPDGRVEITVDGRRVRVSSLDRIVYPAAGVTKADVIDYYVRSSPVLLPHVAGRPLTLKRYPEGVTGPHFYEKQCPEHRPEWVRTVPMYSRHKAADIDFCLALDVPTLVWAANLGNLELHTTLSGADDVERPTAMVFDLDPGEPATIVQCCEVALALHGMLDRLGLQAFAKTSGRRGMQVFVPLNHPGASYEQTKPFAKAVAETLERGLPGLVVARMTKRVRAGRVFVDWSQNDRHKSTVCAYSLRAVERPRVSTPVTWDEVQACREAGDPARLAFGPEDVLDRVERDGDLFGPVLALVQEVPAG